MKKLIAAGILSLLVVATTLSTQPYRAEPIPSELFSRVIVNNKIIVDTFPQPVSTRPVPKLRKAKPIIEQKNTPPPQVVTGHVLYGVASWYCLSGVSRCTIGHPGGYYAAIRRDLLELRGERVLVCAGKGNCVRVTIIDCNCGPNANLIDLYWDAFAAISNPSLGRVKVTVRW